MLMAATGAILVSAHSSQPLAEVAVATPSGIQVVAITAAVAARAAVSAHPAAEEVGSRPQELTLSLAQTRAQQVEQELWAAREAVGSTARVPQVKAALVCVVRAAGVAEASTAAAPVEEALAGRAQELQIQAAAEAQALAPPQPDLRVAAGSVK